MTPNDLAAYLAAAPDPLLHHCVRRLGKRLGPAVSEEDVRQELFVRLLPRLGNHDPARDPAGHYLGVAAFRQLATIRRDAHARRRREPTREALPERLCAGDHRVVELRHDMAVVLRRLPPKLRSVAEALRERSVADAARALRMSRTTLYARLQELRQHLESAGFGAESREASP
jgi:DNA-directed RNA polymerase specialized sigma24 family protein